CSPSFPYTTLFRSPGNFYSSRRYSRSLFSRQNLIANLVNSLRISLSVQPNSCLVAHSCEVTNNLSPGRHSRIMWVRQEAELSFMANTGNACSPDGVHIRPALPVDVDSLAGLINAAF